MKLLNFSTDNAHTQFHNFIGIYVKLRERELYDTLTGATALMTEIRNRVQQNPGFRPTHLIMSLTASLLKRR